MMTRKLRLGRLAVVAVIGGLLTSFGVLPARADQAPAAPTRQVDAATAPGQHGVAVVTMVRARDLMSPEERQSLRRAWREARTAEERQRLQRETMERLQQRAAEHGVVMVIETRVMRPERRWNEREAPAARPLPPRAP